MCYDVWEMVTRGEMVTSLEALEALDAELCRVALGEGILRLAMAEGLEALARCGGQSRAGVCVGRRVCARALREIGAVGAGLAIAGAKVGGIAGNPRGSRARRDRVLHGAGDREDGSRGR